MATPAPPEPSPTPQPWPGRRPSASIPKKSLAAFNACPLFTALGDTVVTGPTGHNLRDLRLLMLTD